MCQLKPATCLQVRKVVWQLFKLYPNPRALAAADAKQVEQLIYPLGLMTKRAVMIIRFSQEYLDMQVCLLHGCHAHTTMSSTAVQSHI